MKCIQNQTLQLISQATARARKKHPDFVVTRKEFFEILHEELMEFDKALSHEGRQRTLEEIFDVIAVLVRLVEGDDNDMVMLGRS